MRGMIVIALATLAIPIAFFAPFLGLLAYCWLSYMRPQDMAFGIGHITFGLYVAAALFVGLVAKLRFQFFRWHPVTWIFLGLWSWWAWCTYHAWDRDAAMEGLTQISRIFLICLVTTGLCTTKDRLKWVVVAIAGSLLFHGTKLGVHGVLSGGAKQLQAIGGLMSGNNENAIALSIAIPFGVHFALEARQTWRRWALWSVVGLTTIAVILTYSRGGFLGLAAAAGVLVWHSRARWFAIFVAVPAIVVAFLAFAPTDYTERIGGIGQASKTDMSAQLRLQAWGVAAEITAEHPVQGIGPKNFYGQSHRFPRPSTMPDMEIHDTYLELSSSLGLTGLLGYLILVTASFVTAGRVRRDAKVRDDPRLLWFASLATSIQAAMTAFLVSSTFGSLAHFDLMYHMCGLAVCLPAAYRHEAERLESEDFARIESVRAAVAEGAAERGPAPAWASGTASPPLSRYDLRPATAAPAGLPDFRAAEGAVADPGRTPDPAPPPAPDSPAGDAPPPAVAAVAADAAVAPADDVAAHRPAPPPRHTAPLGTAEDVCLDASTIELEDMFIDPYGTVCARDLEGPDTHTATGEPPAPHRRSMSRTGRPLAREHAPFLSPLEARVLERPRAARQQDAAARRG